MKVFRQTDSYMDLYKALAIHQSLGNILYCNLDFQNQSSQFFVLFLNMCAKFDGD